MNSLPTNHRLLVIDDNRAIHEDFRKILGETGAPWNGWTRPKPRCWAKAPEVP